MSNRLFLGEKRVVGFKGKLRIVTTWLTEFYKTGLSDSLTSDYSKNGEFPYYEWLNFTSESSYYRKYVILAMYIHAKNAFIHHDYDTCLAELWSVKTIAWRFKWAKRLLLLVISWIKSK